LADWHRAYARLGAALYAVSAETVAAIESAIGRDGVLVLLGDVAAGARFEDAFRTRTGEDPRAFIARFSGALASGPALTAGTVDAAGNVRWTLSGFAPNTDARLVISGTGYDLEYSVRTDGIGMYRGTFGSTAAPGTYSITVFSETTTASVTIDTTR
ncbi:MAG TPA: hypothetical protein VJP45_01815, partial [Candidatus Limnocylindria bacterium]|nr:hypothetical protein [Candidatus Limnocylindria bacterium]